VENIHILYVELRLTLTEVGATQNLNYEVTEDELNDMLSEIQYALTKLKLLQEKFSIVSE
jgi:hypothetical protein